VPTDVNETSIYDASQVVPRGRKYRRENNAEFFEATVDAHTVKATATATQHTCLPIGVLGFGE
jgi:hypothetical protein